jgi:hypothetical protein
MRSTKKKLATKIFGSHCFANNDASKKPFPQIASQIGLFKTAIFLICYSLQPYCFPFSRRRNSNVCEFAIGRSAMPVRNTRHAFYHITFVNNLYRFTFLLVVTCTLNNERVSGRVDMPVNFAPGAKVATATLS